MEVHSAGQGEPLPFAAPPITAPSHPIPPHIEAALWRGDQLSVAVTAVRPTGYATLDAELPGGGWPCGSLVELLQPQPGLIEWRLLGHTMRDAVRQQSAVVLVGPPRHPHLPGLRHEGLTDRQLVWISAETPAERLWTTEQLIKANAAGVLVAWLPQARAEQIRRLQVCAQQVEGLVFLCRPAAAAHEASAALCACRRPSGWTGRCRCTC